ALLVHRRPGDDVGGHGLLAHGAHAVWFPQAATMRHLCPVTSVVPSATSRSVGTGALRPVVLTRKTTAGCCGASCTSCVWRCRFQATIGTRKGPVYGAPHALSFSGPPAARMSLGSSLARSACHSSERMVGTKRAKLGTAKPTAA